MFGMFGMAGMLAMVLVWVGLTLLLIWAVSRLFPRERRSDEDLAREVLGRRYAAGEMTEAEYLMALHTLGHE
jgi:uncharacterized membrane protein